MHMAPLQPCSTSQHNSRSPRRGLPQEGGGSAGGKRSPPYLPPERSASFHGRTGTASSSHQQMRRPKTQPDLLAAPGARRMVVSSPPMPPPDFFKLSSTNNSGPDQQQQQQHMRRVPAKVLVNVNVQRSIGALQVMASSDWTVDQLLAAAIKQYLKEGRRPPLPTTDPSAFGLHYSQFSLECLDPKEKLISLGSRNFFLCPKQNAATTLSVISSSSALSPSNSTAASPAPAASVSSQSSSSCSREADKASKISIPWLRFMEFLL